MAELNMERYDEEDEGGASAGGRIFGGGNPGMTYYRCDSCFKESSHVQAFLASIAGSSI